MYGQSFVTGIEHKNGTVTTTPSEITFGHRCLTILIDNLSVSDKLGVSFDGGTNFKTINPRSNLGVDYYTTSIVLKAITNSVIYEILAGY